LVAHLVSFGALLAILIGLAQIVHPNRQQRWLPAVMFLLLGLVHLSTAMQVVGYFDRYPQLHGYQVPLFALVGPLMFFYFQSQFDPGYATLKRMTLHAIPVVVFSLMIVPYLMMPGDQKLSVPTTAMNVDNLLIAYPINVVLAIFSSALVYLLVPLLTIVDLWRRDHLELGSNMRIVVTFLVTLIISMVVLIYYQFVHMEWLSELHSVFVTAWVCAVFLVGQRYPQLLQPVAEEIRQAKYKKSQVSHLNVDEVVQQLDQLMRDQRLWREPDLTLASLATSLEVTSHQLSQILNQTLNTNFRSYLKRYRIEEAKRRLLQEPDRKILAIALDVGFKSISSFNSAFQSETGMTPSEHRDSNLNKPLI